MLNDQIIGFVVVLIVMLVGLAGSILPGLPGTPLVFAAAVGHRLWLKDQGASTWVLVVLGLAMAFSLVLDLVATSVGAKKLGGTWRGILGAAIGAIIGLFFPPLGLLLGPILGATLMEAVGGRDWREAGKAGLGAALGFLAGTVGRIACCVAMIGLIVEDVLSQLVRK